MSKPTWRTERANGLQMVAVVESMLALLEVSLWLINQMIAVSNFLGVSFDGVERQAIDLFMALERDFYLRIRRVDSKMESGDAGSSVGFQGSLWR